MPFQTILPAIVGGLAGLALAQPANPISVHGYVDYGMQVSSNGGYLQRDVSFEGSIGGTYFVTYADTNACTDAALTDCSYEAGNTVATTSYVPNQVSDFGKPPPLFCPSGSGNTRLHISGISPTSSTTGVVWYQNITYSGGACGNLDGCVVTDGVASITYVNNKLTCTPLFPFWNPANEPQWGYNVGPVSDGYIYLIGGLASGARGANLSDIYLSRVATASATDYSKYQYWNGSAFTSTRIVNPVVLLPGGGAIDLPSILQNVTSLGSITYNAYYKVYMILSIANYNSVVAYTAALPQGPWSRPTTIYTNSSYGPYVPMYAPAAQPRFDTSGKSLVVAASVFGRNNIDVVFKTTFN